MTEHTRVIRLHPDGDPDTGMTPWEPITYDAVVEGEPHDRVPAMISGHKFRP